MTKTTTTTTRPYKNPTRAGRTLVARRRRVTGWCFRCGRPFVGYTTKRFCSAKCQVYDYRERMKAAGYKRTAKGWLSPSGELLHPQRVPTQPT